MRVVIAAICVSVASAGWAQPQISSPTARQTVIGCLQPAPTGQAPFQLIVPGQKSPGNTAERSVTTTYVLTADSRVDLQSHLNEMVEVTGSELPTPSASATLVDSSRGPAAAPPTGTSGRADGSKGARTTPSVATTTKAQIAAKAMAVDSVKTVATKCDLAR